MAVLRAIVSSERKKRMTRNHGDSDPKRKRVTRRNALWHAGTARITILKNVNALSKVVAVIQMEPGHKDAHIGNLYPSMKKIEEMKHMDAWLCFCCFLFCWC